MTLDQRVEALLAVPDPDGAATLAIRELGPGVLGYLARSMTPDDARDAYSIWCEDLWNGLAAFRFETSLRAWGYRLAYHACARFSRPAWNKRRERFMTSMASRVAAEVASGSGLEPGGRRDRLATLRAQLTLEENTLLTLRVDRELEWDEVAEVLAEDPQSGARTPPNPPQLRKRFERLKEKLGRLAREQGLLADGEGRGEDGDGPGPSGDGGR